MSKTYVTTLLLCGLLTVALVAGVNYVVDPYGVHRFVDRDGFNRKKPRSASSGQLVKPYGVQLVKPRTLVLGNSRVEGGIDPESDRWPAESRPVYNMALPAAGIDASLRSLQHVLSMTAPDTVVVGIDFFDFLVDARKTPVKPAPANDQTDFDKRLFVRADGSPNASYRLQRVKDMCATLFSLKALIDSIMTVALQSRDDQPDLTDRGFSPSGEYQRFVHFEGHAALFQQVERTYLASYLRRPFAIYSAGADTSESFDELRSLIELCLSSNVRLILYMHPVHARMLEAYRAAGLWTMYEDWKRAVVVIVEDAAAAHPGARPIDLWDFSGYNEFTTEPVPAASERGKAMKWYWEAGHYKRELGDVVLSRLMANGANGQPSASFGVELSSHNIDRHLAEIRDARARYAETHREEIARIESSARALRAQIRAKKDKR